MNKRSVVTLTQFIEDTLFQTHHVKWLIQGWIANKFSKRNSVCNFLGTFDSTPFGAIASLIVGNPETMGSTYKALLNFYLRVSTTATINAVIPVTAYTMPNCQHLLVSKLLIC